jgi:LysM repeat protein
MTTGYDFYFDTPYGLLTFPITPGELSIKVGSNNETVTLINEGDINILKSPALVEVDFEARFPMRDYPYARKVKPFEDYYKIIQKVKEEKKSFRFIVARRNPRGSRTWDTNLLMVLEEFEIKENADEGDDVIVSFSLKQFKEYGVRQVKITVQKKETTTTVKKKSTTTSTSTKNRTSEKKTATSKTHTVKKGDTLWAISKKYYGKGSLYTKIYKANKSIIEKTAKKYGKKSSSNGHWIYPGTKLTIPAK